MGFRIKYLTEALIHHIYCQANLAQFVKNTLTLLPTTLTEIELSLMKPKRNKIEFEMNAVECE